MRFGWVFLDLDEIKRQRGDVLVADPGAFVVAGKEAKNTLQAGQDVIAEESVGYIDPACMLRNAWRRVSESKRSVPVEEAFQPSDEVGRFEVIVEEGAEVCENLGRYLLHLSTEALEGSDDHPGTVR